MSLLFVTAFLSNHLWLSIYQDVNEYIITPMVNLDNGCTCTLSVEVRRKGDNGESHTRQQKQIAVQAKEEQALGRMKFHLANNEQVQITVTLSDGKNIELEKQWISPLVR